MKLAALLAAVALLSCAHAVDRNKFKRCDQNPFCKRNRDLSTPTPDFAYNVDVATLDFTGTRVTAALTAKDAGMAPLVLELSAYEGVVRFRITEKIQEQVRFEVPTDIMRSSLVESKFQIADRSATGLVLNLDSENSVKLQYAPFALSVFQGDKAVISANARNLLNFETRKPNAAEHTQSYGGHTDSTPHGPSSVGMDFSFSAKHVYGIPEHATTMALKPTKGEGVTSDPYRLFNLDVFEYELDNEMALYGSIPFMQAHQVGSTVGLYWANAAETWVDIEHLPDGVQTHWFSESGIIDTYLMIGPSPMAVAQQYSAITGPSELPPLFSLGYHQCRWNYKDEDDVASVEAGFEKYNLPFDVIWLDIEHTDSKKYFTWHPELFPTPSKMQDQIAQKKRKMVTIIDPHIKRESGYFLHDEATREGFYIKNKDRNTYEGHCWPGSVSYLDFLNPKVRDFWASKFSFDQYKGSTGNLFTWNDMNEPSVFNGPETTMQKDCIHNDGQQDYEHRDVHNLYGLFQQMATAHGQVARSGGTERPFVLSRAYFAGTQNYGAIWTGDNKADWGHLAASTPMLLTQGIAGLPFSGADVGGFFGNPDSELLVRWYQAGAFQPFFRGHAHIETKRREPWLFGEENTKMIQTSLRLRYQFLPLWYTLFHQAALDNTPIMRPLWFEWPTDEQLFGLEDQFMVGSSVLVKPIVTPGTTSTEVVLPGTEPWFDGHSHLELAPGKHTVQAPLSVIPFFYRGGQIIPRRDRPRRNSALMTKDPYTLVVALDRQQEAHGELYTDDEHSFAWKEGAFLWRNLDFKDSKLTSTVHPLGKSAQFSTECLVERVIILGLSAKPSTVTAQIGDGESVALEFQQHSASSALIIRKPDLPIASSWVLSIVN